MEKRQGISAGLQMAALAHDLRTPMCVAAGAAQIALDAGGKDVSAQLRQILQAVGMMDRMLSTMSDMTESHRAFTGGTLCRELLAMVSGKAQEKGQTLSIDMGVLNDLQISADYAALCRLLTNLLGNAIKYTPPGGRITLRAQLERGGRRIRFIVADNGMGMSHGFMRRMFLPFVRAKDAAQMPGSGLGLSIVKDMVRRLGGTIRVRSKRGKGTTFAVCVPVWCSVKQ